VTVAEALEASGHAQAVPFENPQGTCRSLRHSKRATLTRSLRESSGNVTVAEALEAGGHGHEVPFENPQGTKRALRHSKRTATLTPFPSRILRERDAR